MTEKEQDKGLDEIRRMLRSLDEISASEPKVAAAQPQTAPSTPSAPAPLRPKANEVLTTLADAAGSSPAGRLVPPPPAVSRLTPPKSRGSAPVLLGLTGLAIAGGAAIFATLGGGATLQHLWQVQRTAGDPVPRNEPVQGPAQPTAAGSASVEPAIKIAAAATAARSLPPTSSDLPSPAPVIPAATPPSDITIAQAPKRDARAEPPRPAPATPPSEPAAREVIPPAPPEVAFRAPAEVVVRPGSRANLDIDLQKPSPAALASVVLVRGLPAGVTLSRGRAAEGGLWTITASELSGLELVAPQSASGVHTLVFELRSPDGIRLAAARTRLEIPAPSPPMPMADAARPSDATLAEWLAEGKRLIGAGHIGTARLILERAADGGNGEAARLLGDTFDPAKLYVLGARGIAGDLEKAVYWYERADELGDSQAKARLLSLSGR